MTAGVKNLAQAAIKPTKGQISSDPAVNYRELLKFVGDPRILDQFARLPSWARDQAIQEIIKTPWFAETIISSIAQGAGVPIPVNTLKGLVPYAVGAMEAMAGLPPTSSPESKYPSNEETGLNAAKQLVATTQATGPEPSDTSMGKLPGGVPSRGTHANFQLPAVDQTPGTISAYDRNTGRFWENYSRNNPTPTNTGSYDPIGGAQVSETAAMPFNMGGRYTKVNQGGSNMGELRNPDTASAYVKANLDRHQTEDLASQQGTAAQALELQQTRNLMGASPLQLATMQGIAKHGIPRQPVQRESRASEIQATLSGLAYLRDQQASASVESRVARLGIQVSPEKLEELYNHERKMLAANPDAELKALVPTYRPDPYAAFNQPTEQP
jgi:hypothetical protein